MTKEETVRQDNTDPPEPLEVKIIKEKAKNPTSYDTIFDMYTEPTEEEMKEMQDAQ